MTQRWKAAGWLCMLAAVVLAAVSMVLALRSQTVFVPAGLNIVAPAGTPGGLLRSVVFGVVAGVAFFTGLACFFWSAVVEARQQRADIIRLLEQRRPDPA